VWLIFRVCGPRPADAAPPLARFVVRVWAAYFVLAFNLGTMNSLRGHALFELFPAMASLASFAFLVMTFAVSRRFFGAVLVMFASGLLMAATLLHAYLIFALAWWLVLNGIGLELLARRARRSRSPREQASTESAGREPDATEEETSLRAAVPPT
jgi:predicted membrane protein